MPYLVYLCRSSSSSFWQLAVVVSTYHISEGLLLFLPALRSACLLDFLSLFLSPVIRSFSLSSPPPFSFPLHAPPAPVEAGQTFLIDWRRKEGEGEWQK